VNTRRRAGRCESTVVCDGIRCGEGPVWCGADTGRRREQCCRPIPHPSQPLGRVNVLEHDGSLAQLAGAFRYCNGIAFTPDGTLVVVEGRGLQAVLPAGSREWSSRPSGPVVETPFASTSTAATTPRRPPATGCGSSTSTAPPLTSYRSRGVASPSNCCFGGDDPAALFATDALPARVVAFVDMPKAGPALPTWPGLNMGSSGGA